MAASAGPEPPEELAAPAGPGTPDGPETPAGPGTADGPAAPADPAVPVRPTVPADPAATAGPGTPDGPAAPADPAAPVRPAVPADSATPVRPTVPTDPAAPAKPETRSLPAGRVRAARVRPSALRGLLGCVPGLGAVLGLVLCVSGVERAVDAGPARVVEPARHGLVAHRAAKPHIVPRSVWAAGTGEANSAARTPPPPHYDDKVIAVFVHHTDSPNDYDCADVPRIIRYIAAGQTGARDWDDIGYNFLVDRCGTIYEGRAGGVDRPVTGAHTQGFNHRTAGIAAIGTFTAGVSVPRAMTDAIAALAAWKLGLTGIDPRTTVRLTSSNSLSRYPAGTTAKLPALAGHGDGYMTTCPGAALRARLPEIRQRAARLQGRT